MALKFFSFFQRSAGSRTTRGLFCRAQSFQILFREQAASFVISFRFWFAETEVAIMDVDPAVSRFLSCRRRRRLCCSKKESESPESYLDGRGDGCFLVSHAGRRDDDRVLQSKRCQGRIRRRRLRFAAEIVQLRFRRHFSTWLFETSGWCHSIMPSLFILFIQC